MAKRFTVYPKNYVRASRNWREKTECKTKNGKIVHMQNVSNIFNDVDYYVLFDANGNFVEKSLDFNDLHDKLYGIKATNRVTASSETTRFVPMQRSAVDGKVWWVVYDNDEHKYSTYTCFGKYKTKKECQADIDYYSAAWNLV